MARTREAKEAAETHLTAGHIFFLWVEGCNTLLHIKKICKKSGLGSYPLNYKTVNSIVSFIVIFEALFIIAYRGWPAPFYTTNSKVLSLITHTLGFSVMHNKCHGS